MSAHQHRYAPHTLIHSLNTHACYWYRYMREGDWDRWTAPSYEKGWGDGILGILLIDGSAPIRGQDLCIKRLNFAWEFFSWHPACCHSDSPGIAIAASACTLFVIREKNLSERETLLAEFFQRLHQIHTRLHVEVVASLAFKHPIWVFHSLIHMTGRLQIELQSPSNMWHREDSGVLGNSDTKWWTLKLFLSHWLTV